MADILWSGTDYNFGGVRFRWSENPAPDGRRYWCELVKGVWVWVFHPDRKSQHWTVALQFPDESQARCRNFSEKDEAFEAAVHPSTFFS